MYHYPKLVKDISHCLSIRTAIHWVLFTWLQLYLKLTYLWLEKAPCSQTRAVLAGSLLAGCSGNPVWEQTGHTFLPACAINRSACLPVQGSTLITALKPIEIALFDQFVSEWNFVSFYLPVASNKPFQWPKPKQTKVNFCLNSQNNVSLA